MGRSCYSWTPGPTRASTLEDTSPLVSATTLPERDEWCKTKLSHLISFDCHSGSLSAAVEGLGLVGQVGDTDLPSSASPASSSGASSTTLSKETTELTRSPTVNPPAIFSCRSRRLINHQSRKKMREAMTLMPAQMPTYFYRNISMS